MTETLPLKIEFTGGLELLFSNQRKHSIHLPTQDPRGRLSTVAFLIKWLCNELMQDPRKDMFVLGDDEVRPGILVLINDADWELEGEAAYVLQSGDEVVFVSTLHGG